MSNPPAINNEAPLKLADKYKQAAVELMNSITGAANPPTKATLFSSEIWDAPTTEKDAQGDEVYHIHAPDGYDFILKKHSLNLDRYLDKCREIGEQARNFQNENGWTNQYTEKYIAHHVVDEMDEIYGDGDEVITFYEVESAKTLGEIAAVRTKLAASPNDEVLAAEKEKLEDKLEKIENERSDYYDLRDGKNDNTTEIDKMGYGTLCCNEYAVITSIGMHNAGVKNYCISGMIHNDKSFDAHRFVATMSGHDIIESTLPGNQCFKKNANGADPTKGETVIVKGMTCYSPSTIETEGGEMVYNSSDVGAESAVEKFEKRTKDLNKQERAELFKVPVYEDKTREPYQEQKDIKPMAATEIPQTSKTQTRVVPGS